MDDKKKEMGMTGDHHCEPSLSGINRNSEPRELWCIVDRVTAAMASMTGSDFLPRALKAQARKDVEVWGSSPHGPTLVFNNFAHQFNSQPHFYL
jgi:hypothetical protein